MTQVTREDLIRDLNVVIDDLHALSRAAAHDASAKVTAARTRVEQWVTSMKDRVREIEKDAATQARSTALKADTYVHEHPWQSIVAAAEAGILVGKIVSQRTKSKE